MLGNVFLHISEIRIRHIFAASAQRFRSALQLDAYERIEAPTASAEKTRPLEREGQPEGLSCWSATPQPTLSSVAEERGQC